MKQDQDRPVKSTIFAYKDNLTLVSHKKNSFGSFNYASRDKYSWDCRKI